MFWTDHAEFFNLIFDLDLLKTIDTIDIFYRCETVPKLKSMFVWRHANLDWPDLHTVTQSSKIFISILP